MSSDPLDRRLRQLMGEVAAAAPPPPTLADAQDDVHPRSSTGRRRNVLAIAAAFAVLLLGVGIVAVRSGEPDVVIAAGDPADPALVGPIAASIIDATGTPLAGVGSTAPTDMGPWLDQVEAELLGRGIGLGETVQDRRAALVSQGLVVQLAVDAGFQERTVQAFAGLPEELGAVSITVENDTGLVVSAVTRSGDGLDLRQPAGSSRIAIYAAALEDDYELETLVDGLGPCVIDRIDGAVSINNYGNTAGGLARLVDQAARASRCAEARLEASLGAGTAMDMLNSMTGADAQGLVTDTPALTAVEHVAAVVAAASGGSRPDISFVAEVVSADGRSLYRPDGRTQVMSPATASSMMELMQANVARGTGTRAQVATTQAAGFTGTDPEFRAAWFVGTANGYSTAVWLALPDGSPMLDIGGRNVTGGNYPAQVFAQIHETQTGTSSDPAGPAAPGSSGSQSPLCPLDYEGVDTNNDGTVDVCRPGAASAAPPTMVENCPAGFPFAVDTDGDGVIDTCYADPTCPTSPTGDDFDCPTPGIDPAEAVAREQAEAVAREQARIAEELARFIAEEQARIAAQQAQAREQARIANAKAKWQSAGIGDYRLRYVASETTETGVVDLLMTVLVEDENPIVVDVGPEEEPAPRVSPAWTVDALFEVLETADVVLEAEFDPALGYPSLIRVDPDSAVADDEIRVLVTEVFSSDDIELAAQDLETWIEASDQYLAGMPPSLLDLLRRRNVRRPSGADGTYLLHNVAGLEVYVYRDGGDVCLLVAEVAPESAQSQYGSFGAGCQSDTQFSLNGDWTSRTTDTGEPTYLVVVPPARYIDETWDVDVDDVREHTSERTTHSAIVLFEPNDTDDPSATDDEALAAIRCGCGDLTYRVPLQPTNE